MSKKEELTCDIERSQELPQFMAQQSQHQTPNTNTTIDQSNTKSSVVGNRLTGQPLVSMNKSNMPITATCVIPNDICSHVFEIAAKADVSKSLFDYVRRRGRGISILSGNGEVAQATLQQSTGKIVTLHGWFQINSISGTIPQSPTRAEVGGLFVKLSDTNGQVVGGNVIPPLVALSPIFLVAYSFADIVFKKETFVAYDKDNQDVVCLDEAEHEAKIGGNFLNFEDQQLE
ncbi:AT-hook motif nuclear-localized protein 27-like [Vicia villosa]|uniref:AT-hook motif nuclear-localized protein 27-like n=1 Tax=Vicia villosa TaxID=3911 RepID=UPI00273BFFC4|nr:AT-hook motif nuclear-localized protein 27-like [Vicia villosa]